MRTTPQLATTLIAGLICIFTTTICSGDIVLTSSTARADGSGTVGRRGSVDSQSFDTTLDETFGLVNASESQTVGPLEFLNTQLPGTAAIGISSATTTIDYTSFDEINIDMMSSVSLSSIETDINGTGSYGVNAQSSFLVNFTVDEATDYQFKATVDFMDDTPAWQVRLQGINGFIFNELTNMSGDELLASGILQPGDYTLSGYAANGLGGIMPETINTTAISMNFQAARAVPEPTSAGLVLAAVCMLGMRRKRMK